MKNNIKTIFVGNLQDEVYNAFAKLNIIGLIQILQSWQTYKCGVTGPLNSIPFAILYLDQDYHEDLPLAIGMSIDSMYSRVLQMFGMHPGVAEGPTKKHIVVILTTDTMVWNGTIDLIGINKQIYS